MNVVLIPDSYATKATTKRGAVTYIHTYIQQTLDFPSKTDTNSNSKLTSATRKQKSGFTLYSYKGTPTDVKYRFRTDCEKNTIPV